MKKLLNIVSDVKEDKRSEQLNETVEGCGISGPMGSGMPSTPPVTMNVSLNAQGVDNIKELLNLMRSAESGMDHNHSPSSMGMPAVGLDMPIKVTKLSGSDSDMKPAGSDGDRGMDQIKDLIRNAGIKKDFENSPEEAYAGIDSVTTDAGGGWQEPKDPADIRVKDPSGYTQAEEEYANEPDEQYSDHNTMIKDLSGGLNREKRQYAKAQDGDNAMAVRESSIRRQLDAMWREIKEGGVSMEPRDFSMTPDQKTTTGFKTNLKTDAVASLQKEVGRLLAIYGDPTDRAAGEAMWKNPDGRYGPDTHKMSDKAHAAIEKKIQELEVLIKSDPTMAKYMPALKKNKENLIKLGSKSDQSQGWRESRVDEFDIKLMNPGKITIDVPSKEVEAILKTMKPSDYIEYNNFNKKYPDEKSYGTDYRRYADVAYGHRKNDEYNFVSRWNRDNNNLTIGQWLEKAKNKIKGAVTGKPSEPVGYQAYRYDQEDPDNNARLGGSAARDEKNFPSGSLPKMKK